jgi:hypothetical protein
MQFLVAASPTSSSDFCLSMDIARLTKRNPARQKALGTPFIPSYSFSPVNALSVSKGAFSHESKISVDGVRHTAFGFRGTPRLFRVWPW